MAAFNNFAHNDKNTKYGTSSTHDRVSVLFQEVPSIKVRKPTKSEILLENLDMKVNLQCQEVICFSTSKPINLRKTFTVTSDQLHLSAEDREKNENQEFLLDCFRNFQKTSSNIPKWAGFKLLFSKQEVSTMQGGFIPFITSPATDQSTVYAAMENVNIVPKQLEQDTLPVFCGEGVFRIVLNIYLKKTRQLF